MVSNHFVNSELWFVTGSQSLYGDDILDQVAVQSRSLVEQLDASPDVPIAVVWKPVVTSSQSIHDLLTEANSDSRCVGVVAWMHTFSPAKMWIRGLNALHKPLLHLHTQLGIEIPWASIDMDFMNLNQAAHGDREFGYIQSRLSIPRTTIAGHVSDARTTSRIGMWARAAVGAADLQGLRIARFGDNMRDVAVTDGDKVEAESHFGVSVNTYSVNDLAESVSAVSDPDITKLVAEYEDTYEVADELRRGNDNHASLREAARIELGLRRFLQRGRFDAFTTNFEDLGALRQLPGIAVQRLMADGYGFGAEGDWKTAAMVRTVKTMGAGLPGGTSFMEDYTYDLSPGAEKILGSHMLEVCPSIAAGTPTVEIHPLAIGAREDPVRLRFTAAPGNGVVLGICDMGSRFRLVANQVRVVEPPAPLPHLPVACAVWEPQPSWSTSTEAWLMAGAPHHTVLSTAVTPTTLADFATITGTELLDIDATTTARGFARELRWNSVYYHLAGGL